MYDRQPLSYVGGIRQASLSINELASAAANAHYGRQDGSIPTYLNVLSFIRLRIVSWTSS